MVKTTGDGMLVEFASVLDALRVAAAVQGEMAGRNADIAPERRIEFRIGIHQGDIVVEDGDIFGDGVNVAARLEGIAEPGGICVSARVQEDAAGRLDLDFEDIGEPALKNIARPVRVYRVRAETLTHPVANAPGTLSRNAGEGDRSSAAGRGQGEGQAAPLALPDKPSIAVLAVPEHVAATRSRSISPTAWSRRSSPRCRRIRWLFVIARNSSFTYKGQAVDVKRVGRELGVRYVLEGSVRKGGDRVRITAQLIEAETGAHLWADRFDGALEDVFDLQDRVASSVAGVIEPALQAAETARARGTPDGRARRIRAVPARAGDVFPDHPRQGAGGDGPAGAGDHNGPAIWPGTVLGGRLPLAMHYRRMGRGAGGGARQGRSSWRAGRSKRRAMTTPGCSRMPRSFSPISARKSAR